MLAEHRATRPPGKGILRTPIAAPPRMKYFVRLGFRRIETIVYLTNVPADLGDQTLCDKSGMTSPLPPFVAHAHLQI